MAAPAIFLIEDDAGFRAMLLEYLASLGYVVQGFPSAEEVLRHMRHCTSPLPGLVISDIHMGGLSGFELLHELRRDAPDLPVILMTAFGNRETAGRAAGEGANAYIEKPFRLAAMEDLVRTVLSHHV